MSGNSSHLNLKNDDARKFSTSTGYSASSHSGATDLDSQMEQYILKRRPDAGESSQKSKKKTVDCRRSTAAQFFVEEETVKESETAEKVITLLNIAKASKNNEPALQSLIFIKGLIIHKEPKLLDKFFDEVVSFQHDPKPIIRKFIIELIGEACKNDPRVLPKVMENLNLMIYDHNALVQKKVIEITKLLYPVTIRWLCNESIITDAMEATWASMTQLKNKIIFLLHSNNEGVRAFAVKFMERVVIAQTFKDQSTKSESGELSLDEIPIVQKILRPRKLEDEAREIFLKLINYHGTFHVTSVDLMACMQVLTAIAMKRFEFFPKVLQAFESLHVNLPPTLRLSQVCSVRKKLKVHLFTLVKHPSAIQFYSRISIMLSDLGATPQQVAKFLPNIEETLGEQAITEERTTKPESSQSKTTDRILKVNETVIDVTANDLLPKLNATNAADLALISMMNLPYSMPAHFQSTYTPIAAAGTEPQIQHLARLLATQLTLFGLGKGLQQSKTEQYSEKMEIRYEEDEYGMKQIQTLVNRVTDKKPKKQADVLMPSGSEIKQSSSKELGMQTSFKPVSNEEADKLHGAAYNRILNAQKNIAKSGASTLRGKIVTTLATQFGGDVATELKNYILENPQQRLDLAFAWMYQEYAAYRGFDGSTNGSLKKYEQVVHDLLIGVLESEQNHLLYERFFYDLPHITDDMAEALKIICTVENSTSHALKIAKDMAIYRPPKKLLFLGIICELSLHENSAVRNEAVNVAAELHENRHLQSFIEDFALRSLMLLCKPTPPSKDFPSFQQAPLQWSEDLTKVCLQLYLALLPINHHLIHDLGKVYIQTSPGIKKTILQVLENPVKEMSMSSPELLRFVEQCPKGSETLIIRIIHILTDTAPPSNELVDRVRNLYPKRVPDVRFLIPIINGLSKHEVIAALPELIKLNPTVVKEVFHRLLASNFPKPLSPEELLVALHNIDSSKCNLKFIIKATALCLEEKNVYTHVVLAMVMKQLIKQDPLPILLMRTVIQSLANYPDHLLKFVTNILQLLITKKIWTIKTNWEGFIKCCQHTKPLCLPVLLQLPAPRLEEVLKSHPDLSDLLYMYVGNFTEEQKEHIHPDVINVINIFKPKTEPEPMDEESEDTSEPLPLAKRKCNFF